MISHVKLCMILCEVKMKLGRGLPGEQIQEEEVASPEMEGRHEGSTRPPLRLPPEQRRQLPLTERGELHSCWRHTPHQHRLPHLRHRPLSAWEIFAMALLRLLGKRVNRLQRKASNNLPASKALGHHPLETVLSPRHRKSQPTSPL
jgi:hypothetical protein